MRLIRVFPRRTKATPDDDLAYTGPPDFFAEADEVHVSVTSVFGRRWDQLATGLLIGYKLAIIRR